MNDDITFQNMDSWRGGSSGKFQLTFKQICLMHINRCVQNGSCEWHGGYWNESGYNPITKTYVQNSRDVYSNSVKMLRALLLGFFDKQMKEADNKLQEEYKENFKNYSEKTDKEDIKFLQEFKVNWHIQLFEQLIMLSKRLNFFEEESSEDEM